MDEGLRFLAAPQPLDIAVVAMNAAGFGLDEELSKEGGRPEA